MKISGTSTLSADRVAVWAALNDPAVLVQTIPGCQRLEALGDDAFKMTVAAGVGSIKGVYDGEVRLTEHQHPDSFKMLAQGAGAPGTIGAQVWVNLIEGPDGKTELKYDADATVGGMIGGVGQRMLTGVSRKMADEFFRNVDAVLVGGVPGAMPLAPTGLPGGVAQPAGAGVAAPGVPVAAPAAGPQVGQVFTAPQAAVATSTGPGFLLGVVAGAAAALAGAVVGGWLAGRRRS